MTIKVKSIADAIRVLSSKLGVSDTGDYARLAQDMTEHAKDLIYDRTKGGGSVSEYGGGISRLKKLSDSYIKQRRKMRLHPTTSPTKSNLTKSGVMLEEMAAVKKAGAHFVSFTSSRSKKIAGYVAEAGRPFLFLAASELKSLERAFREKFAALVKRRLK